MQRIGEALEEQERNQSSGKQQVTLVASPFLYYDVYLITGTPYMDTTKMPKCFCITAWDPLLSLLITSVSNPLHFFSAFEVSIPLLTKHLFLSVLFSP